MPKPNKHVFVCTQGRPQGHPRGSCVEKGCAAIMEAFINEITARQLFDSIAVTNTGCIGPCMFGPNVLVYPEGVMYGQVTPGDVAEIVEKHLLGDEQVERLKVPAEVWG